VTLQKGEFFERLLGMRLLLVLVPVFVGFALFNSWTQLPFLEKVRLPHSFSFCET